MGIERGGTREMVFWMIFFIGFMWEERERESEGGQMVLRCF